MWPFKKKSKVKEETINRIMEEAEAEGFNELGMRTLKTMLERNDLVNEDHEDLFKAIEIVVRDEMNSIIEHDRVVRELDNGFKELKKTVEDWGNEMTENNEEALENEIVYDEIACNALGVSRAEYEVYLRIQCVCPDRRADGFCRQKKGNTGVRSPYNDEVCHIQCPRVKEALKK